MPVPKKSEGAPRSLLREDAGCAIRDAIVDGAFAPGERLNDAELAKWLGVSRTPVREALARLEESGLVRSRRGRYTMVSPLDLRALRGAQSVTTAMHEPAVREALPHLSTAELDAMRAANTRFARARRDDDVDAALAADEFHAVPVAASASDTLRAVLEQFTPELRRLARLRFSSPNGCDSVAEHERIIALCEARDVEGAAAAVRANGQTLAPLLESAVD
ncbi:GntR family transcriptional regulator [Paractinoplanes hotanensis]|uniref:GntR family transcriptional regulator n=1 Tax=Paractinoplanes hotanensis TaxID=2906497 RepID=A0ABT0YE32_9ACTN|nr:GntR family transcriptional regulator [Actinoplanes hotanensis]MCM4084313.1 GntR family transcriptional regulator [Actinoplanes hotanensis]